MKEAESTRLSQKDTFAAVFLLGTLSTVFLRNATDESALLKLYKDYRKLPAKADQLKDRDLRTQVREMTPYDFCGVSLKMISSFNEQANLKRGDRYEYLRLDRLSADWVRRRSLSADLVHYLDKNSTRLDCTVLQLQDQTSL